MGKYTRKFKGNLGEYNFSVTDLTRKLNYKLETIEERKQLLSDILENDGGYFQEYFDDYYKYSPLVDNEGKNPYSQLAADNNICNRLEQMADYLLYCKSKKVEGVLSENKKRSMNNREIGAYTSATLRDDGLAQNKRDIINIKNQQGEAPAFGGNYKKQIKQIITKQDLEDSELEILNDYQNAIDNLREKWLNSEGYDRKKLVEQMSSMKDDQKYCKDKIKQPIYFKSPLPDSTIIDWDKFDFFDASHVKALLKFTPRSLNTTLGTLIYYLETLIEKCKLSKSDKEILRLYRLDYKYHEICFENNITASVADYTIRKIVKQAIKKHEEIYTDLYYLNVVKGKYKKCTECGENKLFHEFYTENGGKHNLKSKCKECIRKKHKKKVIDTYNKD